MDDVAALQDVIRRVIAARVSDHQLVEDLTQETLAQVLAAHLPTDPGARQGYAIVAAPNLVTSHGRRDAMRARHAHLLVEPDNVDSPEHIALRREEAAALATAMQRLPQDERELLLRHEVRGDELATIATDTDTTSGATAMRLGRARALLRLEYVLAFRRINLPSDACRPVLLALSTGDRRQQRRVRTAQHLEHCSTCAELAAPLTQRRRGIAAWLILPFTDLRRLGRSLRTNHWTQTAVAAVAVAGVTTAIIINRAEPVDETAASASSAATTEPPTTTSALAVNQAVPTNDTSPVAPPLAAIPPSTTPAPSTMTPASASTVPPASTAVAPTCPPPLPVERMTLPPVLGCPVATSTLTATAVSHDEGFWAQTTTGQLIWVQLVGDGESPIHITDGLTLNVAGTAADPTAAPAVANDERVRRAGFILQASYDAVTPG